MGSPVKLKRGAVKFTFASRNVSTCLR